MKRIIFCFDGTSNEIDGDEPTNVLLLSASIKNQHKNTPQIIYYKEGVGTVAGREIRDGATGKGLYEKIKEAYEFLCFNYCIGDEIFVFGFSRGAYTARSFCGFVHYNGIMRRAKIETVLDADKSYRTREVLNETRDDRYSRYDDRYKTAIPVCCSVEEQYYRINRDRQDHTTLSDVPMIKIKYLGIWDTVKTLTHGDEDEHHFHIDEIVDIVESSRHAIATDEFRREFDVTVFSNIDEANKKAYDREQITSMTLEDYLTSVKRAHQELWFPGNHGSVGGGGDIRGLSDAAYLWVLQGAKNAGLRLDTSDISRVFEIKPDPRVSLDNSSRDTFMERAWKIKEAIDGHSRVGPRGMHEVSRETVLRLAYSKYDSETDDIYDPSPLKMVFSDIEKESQAFSKRDFDLCLSYDTDDHKIGDIRVIDDNRFYTYRVLAGERLTSIARHWLGDQNLVTQILYANKIMIPDEHTYQAGQLINLPMNDFLHEKIENNHST